MNRVIDRVKTIAKNNGVIYEIFATKEELESKQDKSSIDIVPTYGSTNPVSSNGAYEAIYNVEMKQYELNDEFSTFRQECATKEEVGTVESIAKGASQAIAFASYSEMQTQLKTYAKDRLKVGQSIFIKTLNVPDVWVYLIMDNCLDYIHTDDEILDSFAKGNKIQIGHFALAPLETQKVNLTEYATKSELASAIEDAIIASWEVEV